MEHQNDPLGLLERIRKAMHDALPEGGLPQDIENRRAANQALAQENHELCAENELLRAKLANYEALSATNQTSPDLWELVAKLKVELEDYHALITLQHRRTVDADRIYQEAHGWPNTQFPDLGELIWWLLDERERLREVGIIAKDMMAYVDMGGTTDKKFSDFIQQFRLAFGANNVQDQP